MKCKNQEISVQGIEFNGATCAMKIKDLRCIVTNDGAGKSLSIDNGEIQFTIPFERVEKYFI